MTRIINPQAMTVAVLTEPACVICGRPSATAHHVYPRGQGGDDVPENLVGVCGSGTTGCHGDIEDRFLVARVALGDYIREQRHDTVRYLTVKLGDSTKAWAWLDRHYPVV